MPSVCPYCKSPMATHQEPSSRFRRCDTCRRLLLLVRLGFGGKRSAVVALLLLFIPMGLVMGVVGAVGYYRGYDAVIAWMAIPVALAACVLLGDGFQSIRSKVDSLRSMVTRGKAAVFWGIIKIGLGIVVLGAAAMLALNIRPGSAPG